MISVPIWLLVVLILVDVTLFVLLILAVRGWDRALKIANDLYAELDKTWRIRTR